MSVESISCPHCSGQVVVQDEWNHQVQICPHCAGEFLVEGISPESPRLPEPAASPTAEQPSIPSIDRVTRLPMAPLAATWLSKRPTAKVEVVGETIVVESEYNVLTKRCEVVVFFNAVNDAELSLEAAAFKGLREFYAVVFDDVVDPVSIFKQKKCSAWVLLWNRRERLWPLNGIYIIKHNVVRHLENHGLAGNVSEVLSRALTETQELKSPRLEVPLSTLSSVAAIMAVIAGTFMLQLHFEGRSILSDFLGKNFKNFDFGITRQMGAAIGLDAILKLQLWRLFNPMVLHNGIRPMFDNLLFIAFYGFVCLGPYLRWQHTWILFVLSGFFGNLAGIMRPQYNFFSGASAATWGYMWAAVLFYTKSSKSLPALMVRKLKYTVFFSVVTYAFSNLKDGIDPKELMAGGITGAVLMGFWLYTGQVDAQGLCCADSSGNKPARPVLTAMAVGCMACLLLSIVVGILVGQPWRPH